jgi:hypothetical protein
VVVVIFVVVIFVLLVGIGSNVDYRCSYFLFINISFPTTSCTPTCLYQNPGVIFSFFLFISADAITLTLLSRFVLR